MAEPETQIQPIRKPAWSLDVKIISHLADMLDAAGDYATQLEIGDGNALFPLKAILYEAYLKFGGDFDGEGNLLLEAARKDLRIYFNKLAEWEKGNIKTGMEKQQIDPTAFMLLRGILRMIRSILYAELNRNFVKFVTIWSETEKMERYSHGRTE